MLFFDKYCQGILQSTNLFDKFFILMFILKPKHNITNILDQYFLICELLKLGIINICYI